MKRREFRDFRIKHSLTLAQAAAKAGVQTVTWARWEAGKSIPGVKNREIVRQLTGIPVAYWENGK